MPNITSATDTHASAKPAVSVTMGARKVNAAKAPPLISAPSAMARMSRGVANWLSSTRSLGEVALVSLRPTLFVTPRMTPTAAGIQRMAIAQNVVRQPSAVPSSAPAGTPTTVAIVVPESRIDSARPFWFAGTRVVAVLSATARNPAFARALSTRVMSRRENTGVIAPMTWLPANTRRQTINVSRGGQRRANAAITGAPTTIPTANAEVSRLQCRPRRQVRSRSREQSREHEF